jgi:hypothetical protein
MKLNFTFNHPNLNMMRPFLLVQLLLTICGSSLMSQPYSTIANQKPRFYTGIPRGQSMFGASSQIKVMFMDSVLTQGGESRYFSFRSLNDSANNPVACITPEGRNWYGSEVIRKANGDEVYFNQSGDSIVFRTAAPVGSSWQAYSYDNMSEWIEASVTGVQWQAIPGGFDSVKTITLLRRNLSGNIIPDSINYKEVKIARDSGLIRFFHVYHFPMEYIPQQRVAYTSIPLRSALFDFQQGDRFQYMHSTFFVFGPNPPPTFEEKLVLMRNDFPSGDSVQYNFQSKLMLLTLNPFPTPHLDTSIQILTPVWITYTNLSAPQWQGWPEQSFYQNNEVLAYAMDTLTCSAQVQVSLTEGYYALDPLDSCYRLPFEPVPHIKKYAGGLGQTYRQLDALSIGGTRETTELIWYEKSGQTCGTPISFTGLEDPKLPGEFRLFPVPVHEALNIEMLQQPLFEGEWRILDTVGKVLMENKAPKTSLKHTLDVSALQPGAYILQYTCEGGGQNLRFVKQ